MMSGFNDRVFSLNPSVSPSRQSANVGEKMRISPVLRHSIVAFLPRFRLCRLIRGADGRDKSAMVFFLIIGTMAGIVLGLRFNVLVLIPAALLAAAVTVANGLASNHASGAILFGLLGTLASLQIGYLVGCVLQAYFSQTAARDDIDIPSQKLDIKH
jgi:hypothetical protein